MEQKFTQMAQEALSDAVQNAAALGNPQVDTLHLLDAMLRQENSMARALIEAAGGNAQNVSAEVHQAMQSLPSASGSTTTQPDVSRQLSAVLSQAEKEMQRRGDEYVTVDLMLVAIAAAKPNQSADILEKNGLTADKLRNALTAARGGQGVTQLIRGKTVLFQDVRALIRFRGRDCDQHEVDGDVLVSPPLHFFFGLR